MGANLNELALFAGAGGGILGGHLLGWRTVCAVELGAYPASVLCARQNDGILAPFPIWDDVQTFDGKPWRGIVDVVSGGFPCQDISVAGKGAGITGERSGMWTHMARIVGEVRPRFVFVENSPALLTRGLGVVLGDLAALGYDCRWTVLGAADVGAPHQRDRFWLVAYASGERHELAEQTLRAGRDSSQFGSEVADSDGVRELQPQVGERNEPGWIGNCREDVADADSTQRQRNERTQRIGTQYADIGGAGWWITEPDLDRVAHGVAARVDRLKAIGNGQVPAVAALAWKLLTKEQ
jgi:DNA (cytosine-5)-methyltransferase 1